MNTRLYLTGFANYLESESINGALPRGQNSPQKPPLGLYAEQLSGNAFTTPRHHNFHSWLYRIHPSIGHAEFQPLQQDHLLSAPFNQQPTPPTQFRWDPIPYPTTPTDFIQGLVTIAGNGSPQDWHGAAIHLYAINQSMRERYFYNADGDFLIVPQEGELTLHTEFGILDIKPGEIAVLPRGIKFQVHLVDAQARGYICENYGLPFHLPELGIIGASGLANARDFQIPVAAYEELNGHFQLVTKFQGHLWTADLKHSPFNVVAWHGSYYPYKYDLRHFNTINSVSFDHPDPSIFTVLTSPSAIPGVANVDFVIFPDRWMVAENTFRPPYYHRNIMSEYMGLIYGVYDAKEENFAPGGGSLHNSMSAHGPDAHAYEKARQAPLKPEYYRGTLAFMFESRAVWQPTRYALDAPFRQKDYLACWQNLNTYFKKPG